MAQQPLIDTVGDHPQKLRDFTTVWSEMKDLMVKYNCLSLGEGATNVMPPEFLIEAMNKAMRDGHNQYNRTFGVVPLVKKVAEKYGAILGKEIDPMNEVLVSLGANASLCAFVNAYSNKGDNVVSFEPMFPMYLDHAEFSGGKLEGVPLNLEDGVWKFDPAVLRAQLSKPESKVFIFNTPHNPTGKVFTVEEMQQISDILDDCPHVITLSDECYEFLTFDGRTHTPFATVGNNWNRTISIFSGGKLFNATGWKLGWSIGPKKLLYNGAIISNSMYYCFNTPGQHAMATGLDHVDTANYNEAGETFKQQTSTMFKANRDSLTQGITEMNLPWTPIPCEGGYFLMADITPCVDLIPEKYLTTHDYEPEDDRPLVNKNRINMPDGKIPRDLAFCRWLAIEKGVTMMPNSFFYGQGSPTMTDMYVRLAICKDRASTEAALDRLRNAI